MIFFHFLTFSCREGFLGVSREGHKKADVIDEKFCGHLWPPELTSKDPRMILTFDTHGASIARFMLQYKFVKGRCCSRKIITTVCS